MQKQLVAVAHRLALINTVWRRMVMYDEKNTQLKHCFNALACPVFL